MIMKINLQNLSILIIVCLFLVLACGGSSIGKNNGVERGRLKYDFGFYVNGKRFSPKGDENLSKRINWCDTSPNPKVEILRCFSDASEHYANTYILRMKGDEVDIQKLEEGLGSVWINDDGKWLLFRKFFYNVETSERIEVKGMPWADEKDSSAPVQYVIAVSPDMKTVVAMLDSVPKMEGEEEFISLRIIDTETGNMDVRKTSYTRNRWLKSYKQPENDFQPPPEPQKHFVWERSADGRDKIVVPILLAETKKK